MLYKNSSNMNVKRKKKDRINLHTISKQTIKNLLAFFTNYPVKIFITNITLKSITPIITETGDSMSNLFKDVVRMYM